MEKDPLARHNKESVLSVKKLELLQSWGSLPHAPTCFPLYQSSTFILKIQWAFIALFSTKLWGSKKKLPKHKLLEDQMHKINQGV